MKIEKIKPWIGVAIALLPAIKLAAQILGVPILDFNHEVDILTALAGGAGIGLVAKSDKIGK